MYGGVGEHFLEVLSHVNTVHVVVDGLIVPVGQIVMSAKNKKKHSTSRLDRYVCIEQKINIVPVGQIIVSA